MFEHLINDFEKFRNKVINTNKTLRWVSESYIKREDFYTFPEESKIQIMRKFLEAQDDLNKLYFGR